MNIQTTGNNADTGNVVSFFRSNQCQGFNGIINKATYAKKVIESHCTYCNCWHIENFKVTSFKVDLRMVEVKPEDKIFVNQRCFTVKITNSAGKTISLGNYTVRAAERLINHLTTFNDKSLRDLFLFPMTKDERDSWFDLEDQEKVKPVYTNNIVYLSLIRNIIVH